MFSFEGWIFFLMLLESFMEV